MADKKDTKKPTGGGMKSDAEVISTILAIAVGLVILSSLVSSFQNRFAEGGKIDIYSLIRRSTLGVVGVVDENTREGNLVVMRRRSAVWASEFRDRIAGMQEKGVQGILRSVQIIDREVMWEVDFEEGTDGWVNLKDLKKIPSVRAKAMRTLLYWMSAILSLIGGSVALYSWRRWMSVTNIHRKQMRFLEKKLTESDIANKNERWERVEGLVSSENPGDWRVAIIEADVMLDELISAMGYEGVTLGEKLKRIEKSDMTTLDSAWEAHKIRNKVAHRGTDFILTRREAKRVIGLYRNALQEFDYV